MNQMNYQYAGDRSNYSMDENSEYPRSEETMDLLKKHRALINKSAQIIEEAARLGNILKSKGVNMGGKYSRTEICKFLLESSYNDEEGIFR